MYDLQLGLAIQSLLREKNLENPVDFSKVANWNDPAYLKRLEHKLADFVAELGLNLQAQDNVNTAQRIARFYTQERFSGLNYHKFPRINPLPNQFTYHEPLIARDITLNSTCEHHLVPIVGKVLIAYIPAKHLVGLNKLNQVLEFFAKRPQLQERLTRQLLVVLQAVLVTNDVAVVINARHDCMNSGGTNDSQTLHSTYQLSGTFALDSALKGQILSYLGQS